MNESLKNEKSIREYLLGRISDENLLAEYEELLFLDEDFCSLAEIVEDDLINDFVFGKLNETDAADFLKMLENNSERQAKVAVTKAIKQKAQMPKQAEKETKPSFFDSFKAFFQKPLNIGAAAVLLIGFSALAWFLSNRQKADELAELKDIYKQERPTETRLSEFDYAPLIVTRGEAEEREKNRLRRIENTLLEAVEKTPSAQTHHALGVFYLTQRKFAEAIAELEKAVKLDEKNVRILNDSGSAYFEKAKTESNEKRLEMLAKALENFSRAFENDSSFLPALFNKSLCLQELRLYNQALESWNLYLEKDGKSPWAIEARKNLERLEQLKTTSKTKEQVLEDFLAAYRARDDANAWEIASQTREMISGVWLPEQISRKFIEAKIRGDDAQATESIEALRYIGNLERGKNADFFAADLADFYAKTEKFADLLKAKNLLSQGFTQINTREIGKSKTSFEESRRIFQAAENQAEAKVAELWVAHSLSDLSEIEKSNAILTKLTAECGQKKYRWLNLAVSDWIGNNFFLKNEISKSIENLKRNLQNAEELGDLSFENKMSIVLAAHYNDIGELDKALNFLGKNFALDNSYRRNNFRIYQRHFYAAEIFNRRKLFAAAENLAHESLVIVTDSEFKNSQAVNDTLRLLTEIYKNKKDFPQALKYAEESLKFAENTADETFRAKLVQYAKLEIADLKFEMGNFSEALDEYEQVIALTEKNAEIELDKYSSQKGKLLSLTTLGRDSEIGGQLEKTLALSEKFRSQILDEESRGAFFDNEQIVYDAAVENALRERDAAKAFEFAEKSRARTLLDFVSGETSVAELEKRFPSVVKPLTLAEIQSATTSDVQIVEYALLKNKLVIWHITKENFFTVEKTLSKENIEQKTENFLDLIIRQRTNLSAIKTESDELFEILIAPVLAKLDKQKKLVIVPDKSLNKLPFAALFSQKTNRYLIEDFAVLYAPSANVFVKTSETARNRETRQNERILSVGNPQFDMDENPNLADLPQAEFEARKIIEFYPQNKLLVGADADKQKIKSEFAESEIFHFAGHYVTNTESAPNSKILLAKQPDGDLRVSEIAEMRLPDSKLVVLSACQTNGEKLFQSEGANGIARTFLAIGAPVVVASNWKVDSEATKNLMISFHQNRRQKGLKIAEALRQSQVEMLKSTDFQSPYFWSAFAAVGGNTNY